LLLLTACINYVNLSTAKANTRAKEDRNMRRGLVVFQFVLSTALIISVMIIHKQMQYIRQMNPGYNREQAVTVKSPVRVLNASGDEENRLKMAVSSLH
jgi:hypothetical protein